jgi:hypothetical protein
VTGELQTRIPGRLGFKLVLSLSVLRGPGFTAGENPPGLLIVTRLLRQEGIGTVTRSQSTVCRVTVYLKLQAGPCQ